MVAQAGSVFQYSGAAVTMPTVFSFAPQPPNTPDQATFVAVFSKLMTQLEACWTSAFNIETAINTMFALQTAGVNLIQAGFTPQFTFQAASVSAGA
jgi:hypothetical protein